ncbi:hypothetical protein VTN00DRAFT_3597 [Thermoascus crustaceus]|uniref:uncharacterized protein n=1 Tax=Thermoascus crustaceus TaxID=5088 RepID=UPI003742A637
MADIHSARSKDCYCSRSYFFQPEEGYRPQYSVKRMEEALHFLSELNQSSSTHFDHRPSDKGPTQSTTENNKTMCIGIVTVKRPLAQNLDVTVGSLLDNLSP